MSRLIRDIITIIPSQDWYAKLSSDGSYEPLGCFALVSFFDSDYPSLADQRALLALSIEEFLDIESLCGLDADTVGFAKNCIRHKSQIT
jgi:hypothetical protein